MVTITPYPTPFEDVNAILLDQAERLQSILGDQLLGLYLIGSLALGDFNPETSDIDWVVVTRGEISERHDTALRAMHDHFNQGDSPWAGKMEAVYIPLAALNQPSSTAAEYPQVERGTRLFRAPLEDGWAFQRYTLRKQGLVVGGPAPRGMIEPVDPAEMRRAAAVIAGKWLDQARQDPGWIAWVRQRGSLSFVVLTLCRLLYSLETGSVASKPAAAHWASARLDGRWEQLILRSLAGQQEQGAVPEEEVEEMLALLRYTVEQCQKASILGIIPG